MKWRKTSKRHALGEQYEYFVQLRRSNGTWYVSDMRKVREQLSKLYGPYITEEPYETEQGIRRIRQHHNPEWYLDRYRYRIYVQGKALTLMALLG